MGRLNQSQRAAAWIGFGLLLLVGLCPPAASGFAMILGMEVGQIVRAVVIAAATAGAVLALRSREDADND